MAQSSEPFSESYLGVC